MRTPTRALVIGGGISGGAVSVYLAKAGREVVLIERKIGSHDKVCGEFISSEAAFYLRDIGIDLETLGAIRISTVRVYARHKVVSADLPFPAFSISRRVLDEAIIRRASACGAELRRGHAVRSLHSFDGQWTADLDNGSNFSAVNAFLATGKHDLKGWKRPPGRQNDFIAFKLHWRLTATQTTELGSCVELFLFTGGYAGLGRVEDGIANLCLVIRRHQFALFENRWDLLLAGLRADFLPLHRRLAGADACWERPLAITSIPYGYVQILDSGLWRLGDQAAVIPSFSGDGISIALHSARLAAEYYLAGKTTSQYQSRLARDVSGQVRSATLLSKILVREEGQAVVMALARLAPKLVGRIASHTRIPSRCLIENKLTDHAATQHAPYADTHRYLPPANRNADKAK